MYESFGRSSPLNSQPESGFARSPETGMASEGTEQVACGPPKFGQEGAQITDKLMAPLSRV